MNDAVRSDLDYIRELAESGAQAPLLGGRFLVWFGSIVTLAYIAHYLIWTGTIPGGGQAVGYMWIGASVVMLVGFFTMLALFPKDKPGQGSAGNRASMVWTAAGISIFSFFVGAILGQVYGGLGPIVFNYSVPMVFAVYACSLMVTGSLAGNRVMMAAAWVAIVTVGVTVALIMQPEVYLAAAAGVFLSVFAPGVVLLLNEPRSTV
jgi:hypothetical protein